MNKQEAVNSLLGANNFLQHKARAIKAGAT
jgi:hypothetical protein